MFARNDAFYNVLNQIEWYYASEKCEYEYSKTYINNNAKILEVGCGKATFFDYLPPSARENYVGLEFSSGAIEQAKKKEALGLKVLLLKNSLKIIKVNLMWFAVFRFWNM